MSGTFKAEEAEGVWRVFYVLDDGRYQGPSLVNTTEKQIAELLVAVLNQPRLVISLDGGLVQEVIGPPELVEFLDTIVVDLDDSYGDLDELTVTLRQDSSKVAGYVRTEEAVPEDRQDAVLLSAAAFQGPQWELPDWLKAKLNIDEKASSSPADA